MLKVIMLLVLLPVLGSIRKGDISISFADKAPVIDGKSGDKVWEKAKWHPIDEKWLGPDYSTTDFSGQYKLLWDKNYLYLFAEITDDTLVDTHPDELVKYWDDDCLEVFIDEDRSKGIHTNNYNAFAYHLNLKNRAIDYGTDGKPHFYDHALCKRLSNGTQSTWEVRFQLYADSYKDGAKNKPLTLSAGKKLGFAIAYCDNDHSPERENFIGSVPVDGTDKNRGYIDAGIFGEAILVK